MRKTKPRSSGEITFVAPFPLRVCRVRLGSMAGKVIFHASRTTIYSDDVTKIEVAIHRINLEALTFSVRRGRPTVTGRLDKVNQRNTLVTLKVSRDWGDMGCVVAFLSVLVGVCLLFLGVYAFPVKGVNCASLSIGIGVLLILAMVIRGSERDPSRDQLAREVRFVLTNELPNVSDLSVPEDEPDGEVVFMPLPQSDTLSDVDASLDSLLKPKREPPANGDEA